MGDDDSVASARVVVEGSVDGVAGSVEAEVVSSDGAVVTSGVAASDDVRLVGSVDVAATADVVSDAPTSAVVGGADSPPQAHKTRATAITVRRMISPGSASLPWYVVARVKYPPYEPSDQDLVG
ncbi:MAG: hypothetical protein OXC98_11360 [bacterium]|nr:hypothetical protein [bacterium]